MPLVFFATGVMMGDARATQHSYNPPPLAQRTRVRSRSATVFGVR